MASVWGRGNLERFSTRCSPALDSWLRWRPVPFLQDFLRVFFFTSTYIGRGFSGGSHPKKMSLIKCDFWDFCPGQKMWQMLFYSIFEKWNQQLTWDLSHLKLLWVAPFYGRAFFVSRGQNGYVVFDAPSGFNFDATCTARDLPEWGCLEGDQKTGFGCLFEGWVFNGFHWVSLVFFLVDFLFHVFHLFRLHITVETPMFSQWECVRGWFGAYKNELRILKPKLDMIFRYI